MEREQVKAIAERVLQTNVNIEQTNDGCFDILTGCWLVTWQQLDDINRQTNGIEQTFIDGGKISIRVKQ